MKTEGNFFEM